MDFSILVKALNKHLNLSSLEVLIAGITIGATQINPAIIFRFVAEATLILKSDEQKSEFFAFLLESNLGKAKDYLSKVLQKPIIKKKSTESLCSICLSGITENELECIESCFDCFHKHCLINNLELQIDAKIFPVCCPNCKKELKVSDVEGRLPSDYKLKYQRNLIIKKVESKINIAECPMEDCLYKTSIPINARKLECPKCRVVCCFKCRVKYHEGLSCDEFSKTRIQRIKCPFCRTDVMAKNKGFLLCKCQRQFCTECCKGPENCNCTKSPCE